MHERRVFAIRTARTNGSGIPLTGGRVVVGAYPDAVTAFEAVRGKTHVDLAWYEDLSKQDREQIDEALG